MGLASVRQNVPPWGVRCAGAVDFALYFHYSRTMEMFEALEAFASLSQETRLRVFRLLIEYGRDGAVPGTLAGQLKIPDNTLSFHLSHMSKAGLITSRKEGRSITYFANADHIEELIRFLQSNCCARETRKTKAKPCNERKC
jgi:ArsR family transcriptional regulator, arsenate/arsenite/antimonite-responsive transcriptional repressor